MDILDLSVKSEITDRGPWWFVTLYWAPEQDSADDHPPGPHESTEVVATD